VLRSNPWFLQWRPFQDLEDELAYMYRQQEEDHAGMQQQHHHFAERLPEQQQYYTPPPPVAPPTSSSPFIPRLHHTSSFPGFGDPAVPPRLPFGPAKNEPGQPSSSSNRILSFGGQPPSTLNFSGSDWTEVGVEAVQQMPPERRCQQPGGSRGSTEGGCPVWRHSGKAAQTQQTSSKAQR
jgi:hypothetical protein